MLPESLVSQYRQYKQDTNTVASWLASTARACGFPADLLTSKSWDPVDAVPKKSGRVKGKARKAAKSAPKASAQSASASAAKKPKYLVAIADFVPLAKFIAGSSKSRIQIPSYLTETLDRVIHTRATFGTSLTRHGAEPNPDSDDKHNFFVGVLDAVRDTLRPYMASPAPVPAATTGDRLANRFENLTVDEPSQAFLDAVPVARPAPTETDNNLVYEAAPQTDPEEALFAWFLIWQDLHKIRARIKWIWQNMSIGVFDHAAAAVTTNTAIEFVRGLVEEVTPLLETFEEGTSGAIKKLYIFLCLSKGFEPGQGSMTLSADFHHATYDIGEDAFLNAYRFLDGFQAVLQPQVVPLYKDGIYGYYRPQSNRQSKSGKQKFEEDRVLTMEFFTELMTIIRLIPGYPVEDEFLRGMKEMDKTGNIPFYLVFATQIYLDIHHQLRTSIHEVFSEFLRQTETMTHELDQHLAFHANLKIDHWPASNDYMLREKIKAIKWVTSDPVFKAKTKTYQRQGAPAPVESKDRFLLYSPVISGLLLFRFRAEVYDIGIAVANAWGSIAYTAHLYNAVVKEKLIQGIWYDMDIALLSLRDENIWVGGRPDNPEDYFKRFCFQMGVSAAAFADPKKRRNKPALASRAGPRAIKTGLPVASVFIPRYAHSANSVDWTPQKIAEVAERGEFESTGSIEDGTFEMELIDDPDKRRAKRRAAEQRSRANGGDGTPQSTPSALILALVLALNNETLEMAFPYLEMHRSAWRALRAVKDSCDSILRQLYDPTYLEKESQLPWVLGYVFMSASGLGTGVRDMRPLQAAAAGLQKVLVEGGSHTALDTARNLGINSAFEFESESECDEEKE